MKTTTTEYDKQAADFLARFGVTFEIRRADPHGPGFAPAWAEPGDMRGNQYKVTLARTRDGLPSGIPVEFDFWGSINDRKQGVDPGAYSVLACISGEINCPEKFEDFCAEYGYDEDSRKAFAMFEGCRDFGIKLREFFPTEEEREALQEIA